MQKNIFLKLSFLILFFLTLLLPFYSANAAVGTIRLTRDGSFGATATTIESSESYTAEIFLDGSIDESSITLITVIGAVINKDGKEAPQTTLVSISPSSSLWADELKNHPFSIKGALYKEDRIKIYATISYSCTTNSSRECNETTDTIILASGNTEPTPGSGTTAQPPTGGRTQTSFPAFTVEGCGEGLGGLVTCYLQTILNLLMWIAGIGSATMIIVSGILFITSSGNSKKVDAAKSALSAAVVGLVIVLLAYSIASFVRTSLVGGPKISQEQTTGGESDALDLYNNLIPQTK